MNILSVVATLRNIQKLKSEQEQCLLNFICGKDVVALLPTGFGKSLIFQLAPLVAKEVARLIVRFWKDASAWCSGAPSLGYLTENGDEC